jgi:hypothetical protein
MILVRPFAIRDGSIDFVRNARTFDAMAEVRIRPTPKKDHKK